MEKQEFIEKMNRTDNELTREEVDMIISTSIQKMKNNDIKSGTYNLVIVMEELAELSQAVSKVLRGKMDRTNLLEEMADVSICIDYIKKVCDISDKALEKAIGIKAQRLMDNLNDKKIEYR